MAVSTEWRILTPYRIETPELTATKFSTTDYVREGPPTQILNISIHWGLLGKRVKYNVFVPFYLYLTFINQTHLKVDFHAR